MFGMPFNFFLASHESILFPSYPQNNSQQTTWSENVKLLKYFSCSRRQHIDTFANIEVPIIITTIEVFSEHSAQALRMLT